MQKKIWLLKVLTLFYLNRYYSLSLNSAHIHTHTYFLCKAYVCMCVCVDSLLPWFDEKDLTLVGENTTPSATAARQTNLWEDLCSSLYTLCMCVSMVHDMGYVWNYEQIWDASKFQKVWCAKLINIIGPVRTSSHPYR